MSTNTNIRVYMIYLIKQIIKFHEAVTLQKIITSHLMERYPLIFYVLLNQNIQSSFQKIPPLVPKLRQFNLLQAMTHYFFKIYFQITLPSSLRSLRFPDLFYEFLNTPVNILCYTHLNIAREM